MNRIILISLLSLLLPLTAQADISSSFSKAKNSLYQKVYGNSGLTFYVNCSWSRKKVDLKSCSLQDSFPKKHMKRALRIEAEHIIPSSWLYKKNGKYRQCYIDAKANKEKARSYCQRNDIEFRNAHNDLINLVPTVGQLNGLRSNKPFAEVISGKKEQTFNGYGKVFVVTSRLVIPDPKIRGNIARVAFYMNEKYGVTYSKRQMAIFNKWDKDDPIDNIEIFLNKKIEQVQGVGNDYVLSAF